MKITNSTATKERPTDLREQRIDSLVEATEIKIAESVDEALEEFENLEAAESIESNESGGTIRMLCVPTDTEGPYWGGSLVYKSGCFDEWLASNDDASIRMNAHESNPYYSLASRSGGAAPGGAVFSVDERGLWAEVNLYADDEVSKNALKRIKSGAINTCSVGTIANVIEEDYENDITSIKKCSVLETSLVYPGEERYSDTEVKVSTEESEDVEPEIHGEVGILDAIKELSTQMGNVLTLLSNDKSEEETDTKKSALSIAAAMASNPINQTTEVK